MTSFNLNYTFHEQSEAAVIQRFDRMWLMMCLNYSPYIGVSVFEILSL